ncbi:MAG: hypothetical protein K0V04_06985 [Deltaproteobacteria bacterium]|nr:hypothetical protein [Deltaproteobacteria bacterium]
MLAAVTVGGFTVGCDRTEELQLDLGPDRSEDGCGDTSDIIDSVEKLAACEVIGFDSGASDNSEHGVYKENADEAPWKWVLQDNGHATDRFEISPVQVGPLKDPFGGANIDADAVLWRVSPFPGDMELDISTPTWQLKDGTWTHAETNQEATVKCESWYSSEPTRVDFGDV